MQKVSGAGVPVRGVPVAGESRRRERKKRQTRDALVHAGLRLFNAKGYEHTAVREITDAVDVSERTFFRYFASKEDLALSFARDFSDALLSELAVRPAAEPPFAALRNALHVSIAVLSADSRDLGAGRDDLPIMKLIETTPTLLAAYLRHMNDHNEEIARVLAEREGVDPAADLRPGCTAAVFSSLLIIANRQWRSEGGTVEAMLDAFDACASQVASALSGHWS